MLEKPDLYDEIILAALAENYGVRARRLEFLPLGNETGVWVYRARTEDGLDLFLKLRNGEPLWAALELPRWLGEHGIPEAVAPIPAMDGRAAARVEGEYHLSVYPFVEGLNGMDVDLTAAQRRAYGDILRRLHAAQLPEALARQIPRENYAPDPLWVEVNAAISARVRAGVFRDGLEREAAGLWREKEREIERILMRTRELGDLYRAEKPAEVLCHADIHMANLLVDGEGGLHVVDWDLAMMAPKERDLMFVVERTGPLPRTGPLSRTGAELEPGEEERLVIEGYGRVEIDWTGLAFYRYNWRVQEIADYGRRIFLMAEMGEEARRDAFQELPRQFE